MSSSPSKPLYVRLPSADADRLSDVAATTGKSKRQLVSEAVREHLAGPDLVVGRASLREAPFEVMTLGEVAALLRLDEAQVEESARAGDLPGRCIGDEWRFSRAAVLAWLGVAPSVSA
jgi:excisionase family DNA binding protein